MGLSGIVVSKMYFKMQNPANYLGYLVNTFQATRVSKKIFRLTMMYKVLRIDVKFNKKNYLLFQN